MFSKRGLTAINCPNSESITKLDASENKLKNIDLRKFANLKELNLSVNAFVELTVGVEQLVYLNISENPLRCIKDLPNNLRELDISFTNIEYINKLPETLRLLNISHTKITTLENLPASLELLYANYNNITSLAANLPKLHILHVNYCQLRDLCGMPDVEHLTCRGNFLTSMAGLSKAVRELNISENLLETWDGFHENLRVLSCYKCGLSELPDMLNVEVLYCHHNSLDKAQLAVRFGDKIVDRCLVASKGRNNTKYRYFVE